MHTMRCLAMAAVFAAACQGGSSALVQVPAKGAPSSVLYSSVMVFNGTGDALEGPLDVLSEGGRISLVGPAGTLASTQPPGTEQVNGIGKTLMPGLIDMHVHPFGMSAPPGTFVMPDAERSAQALLYGGVTTALVGHEDGYSMKLARQVRAGDAAGPRFFVSSHLLTTPDGHPFPMLRLLAGWPFSWVAARRIAREIPNESMVPSVVRADLEEVADATFVKVNYDAFPDGHSAPRMPRTMLKSIVDEATRNGRRTIVHIGGPDDALDAASVGAALLMHVPWEEDLTNDQVQKIASTGVPLVTTTGIWTTLEDWCAGKAMLSEQEKVVAPRVVREAFEARPSGSVWGSYGRDFPEKISRFRLTMRANVRRLHEAGVPLLVGTDAGVPGVFPGSSIHREFESLVALGFSPVEVLRMSTSEPAKFLEPALEFGVIAPGARADLLLVEGNPLGDIRNTERIVGVWQDGKRIERIDLNTRESAK